MIPWREFENTTITADTILCLDIEVTSFWIHEGKVEKWDKNKSDAYYNDECIKGSVVYIWMFGVEDDIYYGREFQELKEFLEIIKKNAELKKNQHLTIYVHNLSYEFQFLRNIIQFESVFARQVRKPMKANFDVFEFRCSYILTNLSLDSWGKQLGVHKKTGELDYNIIRTPNSPLFDFEWEYCEYDIRVMVAGLKKYRDKYDHIYKIPLTCTGEVRNVIKSMYKKNAAYMRKITRLLPSSAEEYKIHKSVFGGGDTHANAKNANKTCYNAAGKDIASSYPFEIVTKGYPWGKFLEVSEDPESFDFDRFCYIFLLKLNNVKLKGTISYLARSRCISVQNGTYDNGRVVNADMIVTYCTEIDLPFIKYFYKADIEYLKIRKTIKKPLKVEYVNYCLQLYSDKTTLKGVKDKTDLYFQQKGRLNSLYGMMVTDIVMSEIQYDGDWKAVPQYQKNIQQSLDDVQRKWYKNFLSYAWGIWVTCHARASLWTAICRIIEAGGSDSIIYYDTDSLKYDHPEKYEDIFTELNRERWSLCMKASYRTKIPIEMFKPKDIKGIEHKIGQWEDDGQYKRFKTLGAKKYLYEDDEGMHLTVSGVPKKAVKCLKSFEDFKEGFKFDNDTCKKGLATYLEPQTVPNYQGYIIDGYYNTMEYGLNLRNTGYTLGLTAEFKKYIQSLQDWGNL